MKKGIDISVNPNESLKENLAYEMIKNAIITNEFLPETMLIERTISDSMNISRTPIREAFKRLESEGYVTRIAGKGVFVSKISYEDFLEIFELKEALESKAGYLCCLRKTDQIVQDLEYYFLEYKKAVAEMKYELTQEIDIKFHETYIKGARNSRLEKITQQVIEQTRRVLYSIRDIMPEYEYESLVIQHEAILNGIKSEDPEIARKAIADHIQDVKNFIKTNVYNL